MNKLKTMEFISLKEAAAIAGVSTTLFALYVQYNPKMGNIWIRKNDEGEELFVPRNFLNLIVEPFKNISFWHPGSWDINWVFVTFSSIGLYTLGKNAIKRN